MHDIVEDYVDNLLSRSKYRKDHGKILIKVLDRLLEHKVRLNSKNVFLVSLQGNY